jgi:hypothetical protein
LLNLAWKRFSKEWPPETPGSVNYVPWVLALAVLAMAIFGIVSSLGDAWKDHSATAYLEENVPPVLASKSRDELLRRATYDVQRDSTLPASFSALERVGRFVAYEGAEGHVLAAGDDSLPHVLVGRYLVRARFEKGPVQIRVQVTKDVEDWRISAFAVSE